MEKLKFHDKVFKPYMSNAEVLSAIDECAAKVNADFKDKNEVPVFLCVLNGAMMFTSEMMKRLNFDAELMSIKLSSYQGTEQTGTVLIPLGLTGPVKGRTVIIFEDIVDTGVTIVALKHLLLDKGAKEVKICTMLFKPGSYKKDEKIDYYGKEIPNDFIVGFGLDYDELGRNLDSIYVIDN